MRQWEKILKKIKVFNSFKKLKRLNFFSKYSIHRSKISYLNTNQSVTLQNRKTTNKGNIEFFLFSSVVGLTLFLIHKKKDYLNETIRLAAAGVATHVIVDFLTYMSDKINTKAKIEYFYLKKNIPTNLSKNFSEINYYFNKKFVHFKPQATQPKKKRKEMNFKKSIGTFFQKLQLRGIQSAMVFLVINSILFYGCYKNIKFYLKEKLNIEGFYNFFLSAGLSQFFALSVAFPLENMKTRMQASNFNYETILKYYYNIFRNRKQKNKTIKDLIKIEYSGFFSHLLLYVVYESVTFGIYESMIKYLSKSDNEINNNHSVEINNTELDNTHFHRKEKNFSHIILASGISGVISAVLTNPIDVYQINKQINPKFSIKKLDLKNSFAGLKERVLLVTLVNLCTFIFLETIGPRWFDVELE